MLASNKSFLSVVNHERNKFFELLFAARIQKIVYPSNHPEDDVRKE